jgi:hypothetical protein
MKQANKTKEKITLKMGIVKGLGKIKDYNAEIQRKKEERDNRATWFSLKDGESAKVRFLQELDADSPNYSEKNDLGFIAVEHVGPGAQGWRRKALCTADEGDCFPCEQRRLDWENWKKASSRLYINVLVNPDTADEFVAILSQGTSAKSITPTLIGYAGDTGSITDREWKITRNGTGTDTSYTVLAFDKKEFEKSVEDYELADLDKAVRHVPYDEQENFYVDAETAAAGAARPASNEEKPKDDFATW